MAKKMYSLYLDIQLIARVKERAKAENRSAANLIETAILYYLNNK